MRSIRRKRYIYLSHTWNALCCVCSYTFLTIHKRLPSMSPPQSTIIIYFTYANTWNIYKKVINRYMCVWAWLIHDWVHFHHRFKLKENLWKNLYRFFFLCFFTSKTFWWLKYFSFLLTLLCSLMLFAHEKPIWLWKRKLAKKEKIRFNVNFLMLSQTKSEIFIHGLRILKS